MFSMYNDGNNNDFNIGSISNLEDSASFLASYNQQITNNISSLEYIVKQINANWENEQAQDLPSTIQNLNNAISTLRDEIQPLIKNYVETLYNIANETKSNQGMSIF